jgi:hypothetical protein
MERSRSLEQGIKILRIKFRTMRTSLILLLLIAFLNLQAQVLTMNSGQVLDRKQFKDNDMLYTDFLAGSITITPQLSASNIFFNTKTRTATIGLTKDDQKQYTVGSFENYVNLWGTRKVTAEIPGLDSEKYSLLSLHGLNGKRYIFYVALFKSGENVVYVNQLSDDFVMLGSALKLWNVGEDERIAVVPSENRKSVLLLKIPETKPRESQRLFCKVIDTNLSELWQNELDFKTKDKDLAIIAVNLDDAGNVYTLAYERTGKKRTASLYQYYWRSKEFNESRLASKSEGKIYGCDLKIPDGVTPIVSGIVDDKDFLGYFVSIVDPVNKSIDDKSPRPFPENYVKAMDKGIFEPEYFEVKQIIKTGNAHYAISIEAKIVLQQGNNFPVYHSSPVLVSICDSHGESFIEKVVYKKQVVRANQFVNGHIMIPSGNDVLVIYNDDKLNLATDLSEPSPNKFNGRNLVVVAQRITTSGTVTRSQIVTGKDETFGIYPNYFVKITDGLYHTQLWDATILKYSFCYATIEM